MKKISIMIVDDHTLVREAWSFWLNKSEHFEVTCDYGDGERAINAARVMLPDIILLDINMEPANGFEVITRLRRSSPQSKIIGVSLYTQPVYATRLIRLGARGYVTKNSSYQELLKAIMEVYKGNKYICSEIKERLCDYVMTTPNEKITLPALSKREKQIVHLLKNSFTSKEIGEELKLTTITVEHYRFNILKKLKVKNTIVLLNLLYKRAEFLETENN